MRASILALLLVATTAAAQGVSPTYTRHAGQTAVYNQVSCTAAGTVLIRPDNTYASTTPYERLSILIKNCGAVGAADIAICPGSATCSFAAGFLLGGREGMWIDWSNGPISCATAAGTIVACFLEERG